MQVSKQNNMIHFILELQVSDDEKSRDIPPNSEFAHQIRSTDVHAYIKFQVD